MARLVVFNKHNTVRVASCWFIIYYRLVMHGKSNIKKKIQTFCVHELSELGAIREVMCRLHSVTCSELRLLMQVYVLRRADPPSKEFYEISKLYES